MTPVSAINEWPNTVRGHRLPKNFLKSHRNVDYLEYLFPIIRIYPRLLGNK